METFLLPYQGLSGIFAAKPAHRRSLHREGKCLRYRVRQGSVNVAHVVRETIDAPGMNRTITNFLLYLSLFGNLLLRNWSFD